MTGIKYYFFIKRKEKNVSVNYIKHITKKLTSEFKYHNLREGEVILNELSKNTLFTHSTQFTFWKRFHENSCDEQSTFLIAIYFVKLNQNNKLL